MHYEMTLHASHVMALRSIETIWLERVLDAPERIELDRHDAELTHYLGRIKEHGNRVLRVVVNTRGTPVRVVTAYFDRAMKGVL